MALKKQVVPVANTRQLCKQDMKLNDLLPHIEVDPETYEVRANGELLTCEPATVLPMAQRYFLFLKSGLYCETRVSIALVYSHL